ncbi:MAG: NAD(P)-dependent oxidoreductase, partial [Pseudomonadota bacterium]
MANQISLHPGETTLKSTMKGCDAMFPALADTLGSSVAGIKGPALKMIERCAADTNHVTAGMARGNVVAATGTPCEMSEIKAETAMKLMLMTGRKLAGKTLGIVGFGRIGRETARRARLGFGMHIVVHNRSAVPEADLDQFDAEQV